ncbi:MAG TPA: hypothetical protein VH913_02230 [Hyphomicrobiaceae bacterium]|jgi:hypothetical protein
MIDAWSWLTFAGLGAFHGLNPAMGWLFAVALGLHQQSRTVVVRSLIPILIGHAASVGFVAALLVIAGTLVPSHLVRIGSGLLLLAWAAYHWRFAHRHRVRFGLQVGQLGLAAWSFLMATAHGAGLMLWPVLVASCVATNSSEAAFATPFPTVLAGVGVHTLAMLLTTAFVAVLVYEWVGLSILRRAWLNVDLLWISALLVTGGLLLSGTIG